MEWKKTQSIFKQYISTYSKSFILVEGEDEADSKPKDLIEEKKDLTALNKRLSEYIERVRALEVENLTLEKELRQRKNIHSIYEEEKVRLEIGLKEEKEKYENLESKQNQLKQNYDQNKKDFESKKNELVEKLKKLKDWTEQYAEKETTIVSLVEELKFYDKIIQEKSKLKQQEDELVKIYEAEVNEFKMQTNTVEQEIAIMERIQTSLENSFNESKCATEKEKQENKVKHLKQELTKLQEEVQDKERLDEEIIHYRTLMIHGERRIQSRGV